MKLLTNWFGHGTTLPVELRQRIADWHEVPPSDPLAPFSNARYVVADTETSGLNPDTDRLLSVGAVGLHAGRIVLADSLEATLRQTQPSTRDNIVVHGIGESAQRGGEDPREAMMRFLEYCGKCPVLAYHAPFDEAFVKRTAREQLGLTLRVAWLDLATILPSLFDEKPRQALDFWLERFGIDVPLRHSALGDALATAQLAQIAMRRAAVRGLLNFTALSRLSADSRWLHR